MVFPSPLKGKKFLKEIDFLIELKFRVFLPPQLSNLLRRNYNVGITSSPSLMLFELQETLIETGSSPNHVIMRITQKSDHALSAFALGEIYVFL